MRVECVHSKRADASTAARAMARIMESWKPSARHCRQKGTASVVFTRFAEAARFCASSRA